MAAYLIGTFSGNPSHTFVSLAIRILHGLNPAECSHAPAYRRILAIGYDLDINNSLRLSTPPIPRASNIPQSLPDDCIDHSILYLPYGVLGNFDLLDTFCKFSTIKLHVYRELYSTSAREKSDSEVIAAVGKLDSLLQDWKDNVPKEYRPDTAQPEDVESNYTGNVVNGPETSWSVSIHPFVESTSLYISPAVRACSTNINAASPPHSPRPYALCRL
ncbi:fungal specific transcription factor domain-containing protein [Aspergillus tanneri]|uniref:Uncharacterized protein n=1 Tax=Aspergillus tanneri TaxID=1220188 RepID=A0A5M9MIT9_9EURO|nr:uncharacterized protein ATNIH1004_005614 [Aspergillus tanneri]KAA8646935.1 hypothetical protein ATNIH1004_005614 [Aspergillus tanneri]